MKNNNNGIFTICAVVGGFLLGMLAGALIFGEKKKCLCADNDDSLGFDEEFFTDADATAAADEDEGMEY